MGTFKGKKKVETTRIETTKGEQKLVRSNNLKTDEPNELKFWMNGIKIQQ